MYGDRGGSTASAARSMRGIRILRGIDAVFLAQSGIMREPELHAEDRLGRGEVVTRGPP
jgi:hypothetical protein